MVSPGIADTAHDRGTAQPSSQRKHWPGYWPAGGEAQARIGLPHQESPFSIREMASEQRGPILAAASAHHLDPGRTGTVDRPHRARLDEAITGGSTAQRHPLLGRINHYMTR